MRKLFLFFLFLFPLGVYSQLQPAIDSMELKISKANSTSEKIKALNALSYDLIDYDNKKASNYAEQALLLSQKINYPNGQVVALNNLAIISKEHGNYPLALEQLHQALILSEESRDSNGIARTYYNIGDVFKTLKSFDKAISYFQMANKLYFKLGNKEFAFISQNKVGHIYMDEGEEQKDTSYFVTALEFYSKAFELINNKKDGSQMLASYINLANAYNKFGNATKNTEYLFKSMDYSIRGLRLSGELDDKVRQGISLANIAEVYLSLNQPQKALSFYQKSLKVFEDSEDNFWIVYVNSEIGKIYYKLKDKTKAIEFIVKSNELAQKQNLKKNLKENYGLLSDIYGSTDDYKKSLEYHKLFTLYKDSILNETTSLNITRAQTEFDFERKNQEIKLLQKNTEIQQEKIKTQTTQRNSLVILIVVIFMLLLFIYYRYSEKNKSQDQIIRAKEIAEKARETQEQFLANTSHEIRTPMNGIIGMTNQLKDTPLTVDQREYLSAINESANSLLVIINDLLDLSKINAGKMTFEILPFHIAELFKNLIYSLQFRSAEKNIRLVSSIDEKIPSVLFGDSVRLNQILLNLIGNAIKFTEKGEVKIVAKLLKDDGKKVLILFSVQDTGIGIQEQKLNTIFDSFTQASSQTNRKYGGTGLGLAIAKQLIEQQGGTISVSSKVNQGSVFLFTLPFKTREKGNKKLKPEIGGVNNFNKPDLFGISILIVDDNKINQRVAALTLQKWNVNVELADSAKMAFNILDKKKADLILMDITMPEIDGFEATQYIRNKMSASLKNIPIIAMTASALVGDREKCISMGMNEYVSKPFNPEELYNKIVKVLCIKNSYSKIPVVDLTTLRERADGDAEYQKEIILSYIQEMPIYLDEMNKFLDDKDVDQIRKQAHKMKSPAKLLGAFELAAQLEFLEKSVINQEAFEKIIIVVEQMNSLCMSSVEALKRELGNLGG